MRGHKQDGKIKDSGGKVAAQLSSSGIYKDYRQSFTRATGLPLELQVAAAGCPPKHKEGSSPFCVLMANTNRSCEACFALQKKLEREAGLKPKTLKCFAGLCETAVPVRVGDKLIAFLRTGQVLLSRPGRKQFNRIAEQLIRWGTEVDLKQLEEAYFNTRVLSGEQYEAMVRLLMVFAEHLAACSNSLMVKSENDKKPAVEKARSFIQQNSGSTITLKDVSRAVNVSANYFSGMFKEATGFGFVEYVGRVRVEKAKNLLQNPQRRITEIAFETGFQSISQFNRVFRKVENQSPRQYRESLEMNVDGI